VSGGNRGIGREVVYGLAARGFTTVLGSRDPARGEEAARSLAGRGVDVLAWQLDVADDESVARLAERVERELGAVHVLVNNAAILYDTW
jgi:NAD(P)-dependent dehydrogenase (short-subunit alcohol dehydrogenase family)